MTTRRFGLKINISIGNVILPHTWSPERHFIFTEMCYKTRSYHFMIYWKTLENSNVLCKSILLLYPLFSLEKKGILISCQSRSVVRPSVCPSVSPCVRPSVTFLVNESPSKPLEVATLNFVVE